MNMIINTITWNSHFFIRKICFLLTLDIYFNRNCLSFVFFFPIQSSEFIKSLNFKSIKKKCLKNLFFFIFHIQISVSSLFQFQFQSRVFEKITESEKISENYRNCYVAEKRIVFKLSKILILNFIALIED